MLRKMPKPFIVFCLAAASLLLSCAIATAADAQVLNPKFITARATNNQLQVSNVAADAKSGFAKRFSALDDRQKELWEKAGEVDRLIAANQPIPWLASYNASIITWQQDLDAFTADALAAMAAAGLPKMSIDDAVTYLQNNAEDASTGKCARYTRLAIAAGGVKIAPPPGASAKDYGPSLVAAGYKELDASTESYQKGDVVVIQGFQSNAYGHMAMYDGSKWISDFVQSGLYPGKAYRDNKPSYKVYRYVK